MIARSKILEGKQTELEALLEELLVHVRENEPGTLGYQWNLSSDSGRCVVIERYADSAAVIAHIQSYQPFTERLDACRELETLEILGTPEGPLADIAKARGFGVFEKQMEDA